MIDPTLPLDATQPLPTETPHGGAPEGNTNALKFDTPEKRKQLCLEYCDHRRKGYSKESFPGCDATTFKTYVKNYPVDFDTDMIQQAEIANLMFWESLGIDGTGGKIKNYNSDSWKFNMQNRFKWKAREDHTTDDKELPAAVQTIILDTKPSENG